MATIPFTIEQIMTKRVEWISSETTHAETADLFRQNEFHALPVVDDDWLTDNVTTTDVIRFFLKNK